MESIEKSSLTTPKRQTGEREALIDSIGKNVYLQSTESNVKRTEYSTEYRGDRIGSQPVKDIIKEGEECQTIRMSKVTKRKFHTLSPTELQKMVRQELRNLNGLQHTGTEFYEKKLQAIADLKKIVVKSQDLQNQIDSSYKEINMFLFGFHQLHDGQENLKILKTFSNQSVRRIRHKNRLILLNAYRYIFGGENHHTQFYRDCLNISLSGERHVLREDKESKCKLSGIQVETVNVVTREGRNEISLQIKGEAYEENRSQSDLREKLIRSKNPSSDSKSSYMPVETQINGYVSAKKTLRPAILHTETEKIDNVSITTEERKIMEESYKTFNDLPPQALKEMIHQELEKLYRLQHTEPSTSLLRVDQLRDGKENLEVLESFVSQPVSRVKKKKRLKLLKAYTYVFGGELRGRCLNTLLPDLISSNQESALNLREIVSESPVPELVQESKSITVAKIPVEGIEMLRFQLKESPVNEAEELEETENQRSLQPKEDIKLESPAAQEKRNLQTLNTNSNLLNDLDKSIINKFNTLPTDALKTMIRQELEQLDGIRFADKNIYIRKLNTIENLTKIEVKSEFVLKDMYFLHKHINMFLFGIHKLHKGKCFLEKLEQFGYDFVDVVSSVERQNLLEAYSYIFGGKHKNCNYRGCLDNIRNKN